VKDESSPKRRRGCLFYGCLTGTVCLVAILLAFLLGLHQLRKFITQYTDPNPMPLPVVQMTPQQIDEIHARIDAFKDAVRSGRPTPPLELSSDEINALITSDPSLKAFKGKLYVTIEDGHFKGQLSVPLAQLGLAILKHRFLNGTATFSVAIQDGTLVVLAQSVHVKGKPLPWIYMDKLRSQNLAANVNNDPHASVALNQLQSIKIKNAKLVLAPKTLE
jgi:hypothetical protein